jgi:short-subunit dehydrogenase
MQSFAADLAPYGVLVTTVHPGFVRTPLTANNRFGMPFLMEPEDAARAIANGLERRKRNIEFPWQISLAMRLARILPNPLVEALVASMGKPGKAASTKDNRNPS